MSRGGGGYRNLELGHRTSARSAASTVASGSESRPERLGKSKAVMSNFRAFHSEFVSAIHVLQVVYPQKSPAKIAISPLHRKGRRARPPSRRGTRLPCVCMEVTEGGKRRCYPWVFDGALGTPHCPRDRRTGDAGVFYI